MVFVKDQTQYLSLSWQQLQNHMFEISLLINQQAIKLDRIITLAKGGWPMTRSLVDLLGVKEVASIGVKFYCGINQRCEKPIIYQQLPIDIIGEKILLFDD
ncbi:phosphoribosyltransferase, partial [Candidatus Beckwithbacteria bacterium CG23_combo_of_CG06-09_8_20_14_all_34_8]